ncbi:MAG: TVP38/TMEM64 family protein [Planctomycetota bacterium]|jgi:hypothetical protein
MTFHKKLILVIAAIVVLLLTPYFIWHGEMDAYFASDDYQQWLASVRPYAWLVGIGLIVSDLFLPIPALPIMATMGSTYGALLGGVIASAGSILAGVVAYCLARLLGIKGARLLASDARFLGRSRHHRLASHARGPGGDDPPGGPGEDAHRPVHAGPLPRLDPHRLHPRLDRPGNPAILPPPANPHPHPRHRMDHLRSNRPPKTERNCQRRQSGAVLIWAAI